MPNIFNADDGAVSGSAGIKLSSDTSGVLNIQTNGTTAISISSSQVVSFPATSGFSFAGQVTFAAGTAAAPSISVTGDTNTGIYFPAADTIAFSEGGVEALRIDSSANVGIGTSSPVAKLNVVDSTTNSYVAAFRGVGGTNFVALGTTSGGASIAGYTAGFAAATDLIINPNGGNLGLGVTPSAWNSYRALQLGGGGSLVSFGNAAEVWSNAFFNGTNNVYIANGFATRYHANNNGAHAWYTAPSGTAGNAITFTQAMTLTSGGDLLVARTTGYNAGTYQSQKLKVVGGIGINSDSADGTSRLTLLGNSSTGDGAIDWSSSFNLIFSNNGTERARITSGGNFCVSATSIRSALGSNTKATIKDAAIGSVGTGGTNALDTGISINQADGGLTLLLLASRNTSAGTSTDSALYIIRFYYDGNNAPTTTFVGGSSNFVTFGTSGSNTLTLTNSGGGNAAYSWFSSR